jgi:HEAT repeat protein
VLPESAAGEPNYSVIGLKSNRSEKDMYQEFLPQLDDPDPKVRRAATKELRAVVDPAVRRALLFKLSDPDEFVRRNVVICLGNWDDPEIAGAILPLLDDTSFEVRCAVIDVLSKLTVRSEDIFGALRRRYWDLEQSGSQIYRKHGAESKEYDLLLRNLDSIDPHFREWLQEQHRHKSKQAYLESLEATKQRIDRTDALLTKAAASLAAPLNDVLIRRKAARELGSVYFDRYILSHIFAYAESLRYLPGRSLRGTLGISITFDFDSWASVANVFDLRFKADSPEPILTPLLHSLLNDKDDSVRCECAHVLRAVKEERAIPHLRKLANRYRSMPSGAGDEAREAISEIEAATRTVSLSKTTSKAFGELAVQAYEETRRAH